MSTLPTEAMDKGTKPVRRAGHTDGYAWGIFLRGRDLEGRHPAARAFRCQLQAAQDGLPVAAAFTWMSYRIGSGVPADPISAAAWAERATALGWPEVFNVRDGKADG